MYSMQRKRGYILDKKLADIKRQITTKLEEDIKSGAREKCYIELRKRKVSILPFFANAASVMENDARLEMFLSLLAEDDMDLANVARRDKRWYANTLGTKEFDLLEGLCGHPTYNISRYLIVSGMKDFDKFYRAMVVTLVSEAIEASKVGDLTNKYSEGVQNTMGFSYYICIKWIRDNGYVEDMKSKLTFVDEILERLLNIPGPLQDYFEGKISESEFKLKQIEITELQNKKLKLSNLFKEILEAYGIRTDTEEVINNENNYIRVAYDLAYYKSAECLEVFNSDVARSLVQSHAIEKILRDKEYLEKEINQAREDREKGRKELKYTKKELRRINNEREKLLKEVEALRKKCEEIPEETKNTIDNLNNSLTNREDEIKKLNNIIADLGNQLSNIKRENANLKKQVKKLTNKLEIALDENQMMQEELESIREIDGEDNTPFEEVLSDLLGKRIVIIGGTESIGQELLELGLNIRQYHANINLATKDLGNYDCLVFMIKYVPHTSIYAAKNEAKRLGKPIVYFFGTNIESLCRKIREKLCEDTCLV